MTNTRTYQDLIGSTAIDSDGGRICGTQRVETGRARLRKYDESTDSSTSR